MVRLIYTCLSGAAYIHMFSGAAYIHMFSGAAYIHLCGLYTHV